MKENHNLETSVLVANAYDEYYIYRSAAGNYFIKYTREFYTKHSALIPEFGEMKEFEDITESEAIEHIEDIKNYYGNSAILIDITQSEDK